MSYDRAQKKDRAGALGLTIALHILLFAILLWQRALPAPAKMESNLKGFMIMPESKDTGEAKTAEAKTQSKKAPQREQAEKKQEQTPQPKPQPTPEVQAPSDNKLPYLLMTGDEFASSDISKMKSQKASGGGGDTGKDSKAPYGPGSGPGGTSLYAADWYRRPSSTELSTYIPSNAPRTGWGTIACKTIERYHVDDCYILGESPRGSGFGRAVLNAAWQFLVMPPRENGKPMVGTWVSIRITYTEGSGFEAAD